MPGIAYQPHMHCRDLASRLNVRTVLPLHSALVELKSAPGSGTAFTLEGHRGIAKALLSTASSLLDLNLR